MDYSQKTIKLDDYTNTFRMYQPNSYEWEDECDRKRMKECLRPRMSTVMEIVEEVCDRLEYEGSMMYDEYPDRTTFIRYCGEIEERASSREPVSAELIEVLMMNEFERRRCRNRRYRCWW